MCEKEHWLLKKGDPVAHLAVTRFQIQIPAHCLILLLPLFEFRCYVTVMLSLPYLFIPIEKKEKKRKVREIEKG